VHDGDREAFALEVLLQHGAQLDVVVGQQDLRAHGAE